MKKLLLTISLVIMCVWSCNVLDCLAFDIAGIEWSDNYEKIMDKLIDAKVLGDYPGDYNGPFKTIYDNIITPTLFRSYNEHLKGEELLEELRGEEKPFFFRPYYTGIYSYTMELTYPQIVDNERGTCESTPPTEVEIFISRDTNEVFGYALCNHWSKPSKEKVWTKNRIGRHGKPTKIFNEGDKDYETYKWEKDGEILYLTEDPNSVTMVFVNIDRLRDHIKKIKKQAKKEGIIK